MSVLDLLTQQLGDDNVLSRLSNQIGADKKSTAAAVSGALPMLLGALSQNTQQSNGAQSLLGALDRDHDGSILDDIAGFLGNNPLTQGNGSGILGHILGGRQAQAENSLSKVSGLGAGQIGQLLTMLAPIVMSALAKSRQGSNLDANGLNDMLQNDRQRVEQMGGGGLGGMLGKLLDQDGDGDVMDDVAQMGAGLLGSLLGGRR